MGGWPPAADGFDRVVRISGVQLLRAVEIRTRKVACGVTAPALRGMQQRVMIAMALMCDPIC